MRWIVDLLCERFRGGLLLGPALLLMAWMGLGCLPNMPVASPDGRMIAAALTSRGELRATTRDDFPSRPQDLYIFTPGGEHVWRVTDFSLEPEDAASSQRRHVSVAFPAFSPDQDSVAFVARYESEEGAPREGIFVIHGVGSILNHEDLSVLDEAPTISWSRAIGGGVRMAEVEAKHMMFPAFSPSGRYLAWIEVDPEQVPVVTRQANTGGYWGQLRVLDTYTATEMPLPEGHTLDAVIPELAWISNRELAVMHRADLNRAHPAASEVELKRVTLPHSYREEVEPGGDDGDNNAPAPEERPVEVPGHVDVLWRGWNSSYRVGLTAHPSGALAFDQFHFGFVPRHTQSTIWYVPPGATALGAEDNENGAESDAQPLIASSRDEPGFLHSPHFERVRGDNDAWVLRHARESRGETATEWSLAAEAYTVSRTGRVGEALPQLRREAHVDGALTGGYRRGPLEPFTGMLPGGGGILSVISMPTDGVAEQVPLTFNRTVQTNTYNGRMLMLADESSDDTFTHRMKPLVQRINQVAPDKYLLLEAARETMRIPRRVDDSVLLLNVAVHERNEDGATQVREGIYYEFVSDGRIRTEETYAGSVQRTFDGGQQVGVRSGAEGDFRTFDLRNVPRPYRHEVEEIVSMLGERLRWHRMLLLQSITEPMDSERHFAGDFDLTRFVRSPAQLDPDGEPRPLIFIERSSRYQRLKYDRRGEMMLDQGLNPPVDEVYYIGFEVTIASDGIARVWPRELRARNAWLGDDGPGDDGREQRQIQQTVLRFVGDFRAVESGTSVDMLLPRRIVSFESGVFSPLQPLSPDAPILFEATLQPHIPDYPYSARMRRLQSGVNQGIPNDAFRRLMW